MTWFLLGWKYLPVWLFVIGIAIWLLVPILSPSIKMIHNEFGWRTFLRLVFTRRTDG